MIYVLLMMTVVSFLFFIFLFMSCTLHIDLFHQLGLKNPPYYLVQKYITKIMSERKNEKMLNNFLQLYTNCM